MCVSCGCGEPNETHGDANHITLDMVQRAASAAGIAPQDVATNIQKGLDSRRDDAKREDAAGSTEMEEPVVTEAHGSVM